MAVEWHPALAQSLRTSGYRAGEKHAQHLTQGQLTPGQIDEALDAIHAGDWDLLAFFAPRPTPLRDRAAWGRQFHRCVWSVRQMLPVGARPSLRDLTEDQDLALRSAYIVGLSAGFHDVLAAAAGHTCPGPYAEGFLEHNLP